ncbi:S-adenosyl-L-methionine-dependent methyltransferase [Glonium stellatum]|uniref:S-adenosyl-L-methionine-dependent methyltransferase n=1 Tax=Glonium stellatum TaxID=574774 RepID=A0A8E2EUZ2_9PEZI|nr:S-adenosyl-L-methionine-dependent methyltransferase [Glonium stellatum]
MTLSELIETLNNAADASLYSNASEEERMELIAACAKLQGVVETPTQLTWRVVLAPHLAVALRLGIDMKLFDVITSDKREVTVDQLASRVDADPLLVRRIIRILCGMSLFKEISQDTFERTPAADAYVTGSPLVEVVIMMTSDLETLSKAPSYFEENGFTSPRDAYNGPFQYALGTKLTYFDWLPSKPRLQQAVSAVMAFARSNRGEDWLDFFPVSSKLRVDSPSDPLIVDIGGGLGQVLRAFKHKYPDLPGKLILQDLPVVIDSVQDLPAGIEAMPHDFFAQQPIRGARAYYLRAILHDWPDKQAHKILGSIKEAMSEGSILLIDEIPLPESNVSLFSAQMDFMMMLAFSSLERTRTQFKTLLDDAGFDLVRIWTSSSVHPLSSSLLEAVLKKP